MILTNESSYRINLLILLCFYEIAEFIVTIRLFFNSRLYIISKHISFVCLISALDPKETTFMNGGQLYWDPQDLSMKEGCSFLTLPFHQTIHLNPLRSV